MTKTPRRRRRRPLHSTLTALFVVSLLTLVIILGRYITRLTYNSPSPARIAYFIQVSSSNLALLPRLLLALYHKDNLYAVHLDLKIPARTANTHLLNLYRTVSQQHGIGAARNVPNLLVVRSEPITYRGTTMTMNYLTGSNKLLAAGEWDFFVNLSGADYPTASQTIIRELLGLVKGKNFVEWKPRSTWAGFAERRLGEFYIDTGLAKLHSEHTDYMDGHGGNVTKESGGGLRNPVVDALDFVVAKTSGWFILSRRMCEHLRGDSEARKMLMLMAFSDASDEHYVGSVLWNGGERWRRSVVGSNLRSIFFVAPNGSFAMGEDGMRSRQHPFYVDEGDGKGGLLFWKPLMAQPGFFTRKVRETGGELGFRDRVDREMIGLSEGAGGGRVRVYEKRLRKRFERLVNEYSDPSDKVLDADDAAVEDLGY